MSSPEPASAIPNLGPDAYAHWRASELGVITERLERQLIVELVGNVEGCRILDVRCGDGEFAVVEFAKGGAIVVCIDASPEMIDAAKARSKPQNADVSFQVATTGLLPFPAGQFDVATAITILCFMRMRPLCSRRSRACCDPEAASSSANWASGTRGQARVVSAPGSARSSGARAASGRRMNCDTSPSKPVLSSGPCAGRSTTPGGALLRGSWALSTRRSAGSPRLALGSWRFPPSSRLNAHDLGCSP
jgi:hypothetical protein